MRMIETTDKLFLAEPGTIEQSLLFLEFYLFERFRLVHMIKKCDHAENYDRWKFLTNQLKVVEEKISEERDQISIFEEITEQSLTGSNEECKIFNIQEHNKGDKEDV